jgi:hypothetical protein
MLVVKALAEVTQRTQLRINKDVYLSKMGDLGDDEIIQAERDLSLLKTW